MCDLRFLFVCVFVCGQRRWVDGRATERRFRWLRRWSVCLADSRDTRGNAKEGRPEQNTTSYKQQQQRFDQCCDRQSSPLRRNEWADRRLKRAGGASDGQAGRLWCGKRVGKVLRVYARGVQYKFIECVFVCVSCFWEKGGSDRVRRLDSSVERWLYIIFLTQPYTFSAMAKILHSYSG